MKRYKKIARNTSFLGKRSRLMLCDDHLLLIGNLFGAEEYRRFFFEDLQFITVFKTSQGWIYNLIVSISLSITLFLAVVSLILSKIKNEDFLFGVSIFFAIIAVILVVALVINLIKGPTSKVMISTLNSQDTLTLTGSFYKTIKVINKIRPFIEKHQGPLTQKELVEQLLSSKTENNSNEKRKETITQQ